MKSISEPGAHIFVNEHDVTIVDIDYGGTLLGVYFGTEADVYLENIGMEWNDIEELLDYEAVIAEYNGARYIHLEA